MSDETCQHENPAVLGMHCDKPVHPFGSHMNRSTSTVWAGLAMPEKRTRSGPRGARVKGIVQSIEEAGANRRTGPPDSGEARKEVGIHRVIASTPEQYRTAFLAAVADLVASREPFTSEDVTAAVGMPPEGVHQNAVGALFSSALRHGDVQYLGHVKATRANQNATRIGQYQGV